MPKSTPVLKKYIFCELNFVQQNFTEFRLEYQEPIIRSNTPSNPEQKIHAEGRGAKLFRKRQGQGSFLAIHFI